MTAAQHHSTRRVVLAGGASALAACALAHSAAAAFQADRDLLDLLVTQEQMQIAHYTAMLEAFDVAAFAAAGLPERARSGIGSILAAEEAHLAALSRPDGGSVPAPAAPAPLELIDAMQEAAELENLAVASYALVIQIGRAHV